MEDRTIEELKEENLQLRDRMKKEMGIDVGALNLKAINELLRSLAENRRKEIEKAKKDMTFYINGIKEMNNKGNFLSLKEKEKMEEDIRRFNLEIEKLSELEELAEGKTPNNTITLVDKITYNLAGGRIPYRETQPLKVEKGRNKKQLTTFVTLDTDMIGDMLPNNIEGEDINLLEAIISLAIANEEEGINVFTFNDIYRVEKKNLTVNPNRKIQEELERRILKLMVTLITIDSSEEKQAYYKDTDLFYRQTSNLLNADFIEVEVKGNKTKAIRVLDIPLLYKYAKAKKQLTNIPFVLTDNQLVKTDAVLKLEKYLCRRIAQMRKSKKLTNIILFSTIYDNMNYKQKSKGSIDNAKAKTRINTEEVLKGLIATDYIKNYQIESEGRNQYHRLIIEL